MSMYSRLMNKVVMVPEAGCWLWAGAANQLGYGIMGKGGRGQGNIKTHRASWICHQGDIPSGMNVLHKCDTPSCVNPAHLYLGTLKDNARDTVSRGRDYRPDNRGERASWSKLNNVAVAHIRQKLMTGVAYARMYGVSKSAIYAVWSGDNWSSV